jgi:hypothetical protein
MTTDATAVAPDPEGPIVARAGSYYRMTRYIMTFILFVYGGWSIYDGFYSWPRWPISHPNEQPKTQMDINFNRVLGMILPPLGILLLIRCIYNSRGEYRLEDGVVHIPGYPPVPLDKIHAVDKELWERKGIAYVSYELPPGTAKAPLKDNDEFALDDFVYEREPTDAIFTAIEASLLKGHPAPEAAARPKEAGSAAPVAKPAAVVAKPAAPTAPAPKPAPAAPRPAAATAAPAVAKPAPAAPRPAPVAIPRPGQAVVKPGAPAAKPVIKPAPSARPTAPPSAAPTKTPPRPQL